MPRKVAYFLLVSFFYSYAAQPISYQRAYYFKLIHQNISLSPRYTNAFRWFQESVLPLSYYGSCLLQELWWIRATERIFDSRNYFLSIASCGLDENCVVKKTLEYGNSTYNLFYPRTIDASSTTTQHCRYSISHGMVDVNMLTFTIRQYACISNIVQALEKKSSMGGSNFEVFLRVDNYIFGCSFIDYFNDSYTALCNVHDPLTKLHLSDTSSHSYYVTVILNGEFYDTFIEHWSLNVVETLLDDYPLEVTFPNKTASKRHISPPFIVSDSISNLSNSVVWYSVIWKILDKFQWVRNSSTPRVAPRLISNVTFKSSSYLLQRLIYNERIHLHGHYIASQSSPRDLADRTKTSRCHCVGCNTNSSSSGSPHPMHFYLLGESHMRHTFDLFLLRAFGHSTLLRLDQKHRNERVAHLSYNYSNYASTQIPQLEMLCQLESSQSRHNHNSTYDSNITIVFQTGHWDLGQPFASLRRLLEDSGIGMRLMNLVRSILTAELPCGRLTHFIWVTTVPYPFCLPNHICKKNRGRRTNSNLRALNDFYTSQLLSVKTADHIQLSIVDSFNILYPRIFLREESEVVCANHFLCRSRTGLVAETPGGVAVVDAITAAICDHAS